MWEHPPEPETLSAFADADRDRKVAEKIEEYGPDAHEAGRDNGRRLSLADGRTWLIPLKMITWSAVSALRPFSHVNGLKMRLVRSVNC